MPRIVGSHDSHLSIPDSLPSLSDHASISSADSVHSSFSSRWSNPPDTQSLSFDHTNKMPPSSSSLNSSRQRNAVPQRSATIKAGNRAGSPYGAAASGSTSHSSAPIATKRSATVTEPSIVTASDISLASLSSPPVVEPLVFSSGEDNIKRSQALREPYLALDEAQPRLSMSSTGSGSSNELATPEKLHQAWPYGPEDDSALAALQASSASSSSHAYSQDHSRSHSGSSQPIHIETTEPESDSRPPSRQVDAASAQLDRLVLQRPAKLERLSSAATTATAKASDESSPQTATQSPRHLQTPDLSLLRISSSMLQSMPASAPAASSTDQFIRSPSLDTDIPSRASMTSPDSWRSLLPEHDPYFASEGQLRAPQPPRSASPLNMHASPSAFDIDTYVAAKTSSRVPAHDRMSTSSLDTARTSFSSAISGYSTMSMSGLTKSSMQSQDSARSDSWRSLLPDDDRFHASCDNSVAGGAQRGANLSPSLASPSLSDRLDSPTSLDCHNHRSAFFALDAPRCNITVAASDPDSAARRHSSFSSVEPNNSKQFAATRVMLASMRDTPGSFGSIKSASEKFDAAVLPCASSSSLVNTESTHSQDSLEASNMTPELSQSSAADDDSGERDSWPTSRSGRYGAESPISTGPLTPETGHTPNPKSSSTAMTAQQQQDKAHDGSPSHVSETSDSVLKTTQDGLMATTTTTTTKTTTTTRTQLLSGGVAANKARSEAGVDASARPIEQSDGAEEDEDADMDTELLQSQPMKARTSSCSISTPISPPSLPFLERRPAPPETDLVIETERTRYVLVTRLPGFSLDCITLATKQHAAHRTLHIVADKWDTESGGHFERRITFPDKECDLINVKAEFDGNVLRVYVPRRVLPKNRFSSASSATF